MPKKQLYGFRGAVCTENTASDIAENVCRMFSQLLSINNISENDIVSIHFTVTPDITELNPASALRKAGFCTNTPLFCSLEPVFKGSLGKVIRILMLAYSDKPGKGVYLNGAQVLRPDLTENFVLGALV